VAVADAGRTCENRCRGPSSRTCTSTSWVPMR
jgi:hypothetical protein